MKKKKMFCRFELYNSTRIRIRKKHFASSDPGNKQVEYIPENSWKHFFELNKPVNKILVLTIYVGFFIDILATFFVLYSVQCTVYKAMVWSVLGKTVWFWTNLDNQNLKFFFLTTTYRDRRLCTLLKMYLMTLMLCSTEQNFRPFDKILLLLT